MTTNKLPQTITAIYEAFIALMTSSRVDMAQAVKRDSERLRNSKAKRMLNSKSRTE